MSLEEVDSVQFALGVRNFDVAKHQPHPPGYPVYVFLGWLGFQITHEMALSLAAVNAVSAALAIVPFYYLTRNIFNEKVALVSSALLVVNPGYWLTAEKSLSDGLAASLIILSVYLLYTGVRSENNRRICLSSIAFGMAVGARLTSFPFGLLWIVFLRKKLKALCYSGALFLLTCLTWFIPMIYLTGYDRYLTALRSQSGTVYLESIFNPSITSYEVLTRVLYEYPAKALLWVSFGAVPHLEPLFLEILSALSLGILFWLAVKFARNVRIGGWNPRRTFFTLVLFPYSVWTAAMMLPLNDRFLVPTVPWICMLLGWIAVKNRTRHRGMNSIIILFLVLATSIHSIYYANVLHSVPSPPTQLVSYVATHYDPKRTMVLATQERRYFEFYQPEYTTLSVFEHENTVKAMQKFNGTILVTEYAIGELSTYATTEGRLRLVATFEREILAHRKTWKIALYEYQK